MSDGTPNRQILLRMVFGGFREHGEHRAAAERMTDHRVHGSCARSTSARLSRNRGRSDRLPGRRRHAPARRCRSPRNPAARSGAMKAAEARRVTAPAVQQHHAGPALAPVPDGESRRAPQRSVDAFRLRDDGRVCGLDLAARRREKQAKGEPARERHAEPLQPGEKLPQPPLQGRAIHPEPRVRGPVCGALPCGFKSITRGVESRALNREGTHETQLFDCPGGTWRAGGERRCLRRDGRSRHQRPATPSSRRRCTCRTASADSSTRTAARR